ncbi:facilitated trehalose transporter Tret1-like [Harmonia axyridis]|uniref:facilitated trehalose transporter Tret1-like n=1 Tax=Harmonia axyridis TaxID=115357 RepID=UPI001E27638B|nr:facilitated trehalose transporter Tret1-like [Harmonia axyridis]
MFNLLSEPWFKQILVAIGPIAITGVLGMTEGYSAILLPQLQEKNSTIKINTQLSSLIASMSALPMAGGCILGGYFMGIIGRKGIHIWSCVPLVLGWLLIAFAPNVVFILVGRFLTGLSDGLLGPPTGVYIAETSHPSSRGVLIVLACVSTTSGLFAVHLLGTFFTWRVTALISGLIPVPLVIFMFFMPESPTYLAKRGRLEEATKAFYWCRGESTQSQIELKELIERQKNIDEAPKLSLVTQIRNIRDPKFWKPTIMISILFFTSQITGNNAMASYSIKIIQECGLKGEVFDEYLAMVVMDSFRTLASVISCVLVFKLTRRNLMKLGGFGVSTSLFLLISYLFIQGTTPDSPMIVLGLLMTYVFFIAVGLMPLSWTMMGEIFPLAYRGLGTAITSFVCYASLYSVVQTFPFLFEYFGNMKGVLAVYGVCTLCGTVLLTLFLPETKDKPLHEIEDSFVSNKCKKEIHIQK